jgi:hypothetical protein
MYIQESMKELERRYTQEEIDDLLETGGIEEVIFQYRSCSLCVINRLANASPMRACDKYQTVFYVEVKHSAKGRITMYVDKSNWERSITTTKCRGIKNAMSKQVENEQEHLCIYF